MTSGSHFIIIECKVREVREQRKTAREGDRGIIHSGTDREEWKQKDKEREVSSWSSLSHNCVSLSLLFFLSFVE